MRLVRVDDRRASVIAIVSGVVAAWSGASPTGAQLVDAVLVFLAAAVVTWASASAPWWAITTAAGVGALLAIDPWITVIGAATALAGMWVGTQQRDVSLVRAALGGLVANVLCRLEFGWFFGASAVVGATLGLALVVVGLQRRHSVVRRWALRSALALAGLIVVAVAGLGLAGRNARSDVTAGRELVADGIELLRDGEYIDAAERFDRAADAFESAHATIERPWTQPARLIPIAAQNRRAVSVIAEGSASASVELANASLFIDPADLQISDGRFDLEQLAEIEPPLTAAYESMVALRAAIESVNSPWLVDAIETRLDAAAAEFDDNIDAVETTVQALQLAPSLLGGDGARDYFVAFTTPAEARGLGGFMGNYAVLTADDGQLSMSEFGRASDLNRGGSGERRLDPPEDWAAVWGRLGLTSGPGGTTGEVPWSNITVSPHFPSTAAVIADLYPQSGGRQVDGVFALDPFVLETMVGFTGPLSVELGGEGTQRLTDANTAQFLLFDQYTIEDVGTRTDLLEEVAAAVIDDLLGGALPGPTDLADQLTPLVDEGRLVGWMNDADEQGLMERVGLSGRLPDRVRVDGFQVVVNNAGANKLDAFLDRSIAYRAEYVPETEVVFGTLDVTLINNGPTEGLPSGVIDNYVGDPIGTNRSLVTAYMALPVTGVTVEGDTARFEPGEEAGWHTSQLVVVVPPGEARTVSFTVAGRLDLDILGSEPDAEGTEGEGTEGEGTGEEPGRGSYELVVGTQPLVSPADYEIVVTDPAGTVLLEFDGRVPGSRRLTSTRSGDPAK